MKTTIFTLLSIFLFGIAFAQDGNLPGDANCDGVVNVVDVITLSNYYIGNAPEPFCFINADVNGDGEINIMDITLTVDIFIDDDPGDDTVTDIDGNIYQTVAIGGHTWMAENLRVTRYNNEDNIPTGFSNTDWTETTSGAYAIYNDDDDMLEAYGKLYNWYAVADSRGLCPDGWRLPTNDEWSSFTNYLIDNYEYTVSNVGNALKDCRQVSSPLGGDCDTNEHPRWNQHFSQHGNDAFGFSVLPGGARMANNGTYSGLGAFGAIWTATPQDNNAFMRSFNHNSGAVTNNNMDKKFGMSVRCIMETDH